MVSLWWVFGAYYNVDVTGSLVFVAIDGSCSPSEQFGVHCFGDYAASATRALSENPWSESNTYAPYLAGGYLIPLLTAKIGQLVGEPRLGVVLYQFMAIIALAVPWIWLLRQRVRQISPSVAFALIGPLSLPGLFALDRGNNVAFVVPGLMLFLVGVAGDKGKQAVLGLALASLVKPQYVLLLLTFVVLRKLTWFLLSVAAVTVSQLSSYLLWPQSIPGGIAKSVQNLRDYNNYVSVASDYPPQIGFGRGVYLLLNWFTREEISLELTQKIQSLSGPMLVLIFALICLYRTDKICPRIIASSTIVLASLTPGTTWTYYIVFIIPIVAFDMSAQSTAASGMRLTTGISRAIFICAVVVTVIQFPFPFMTIHPSFIGTSSTLIPIVWLLFLLGPFRWFPKDSEQSLVDA